MLDFPAMLGGIHLMVGSVASWGWIVPGLIVGLVFAAIPGITIAMAMAIVLPMTLYMDFFPSVVFLTSVYTGAGFGGSVPAILMNIPGTPTSYATTFDGYAMAQKGQHNEALGYALFASTLCGIAGYLVLLVVVEPLANIVLKIGPFEMFMVAVWGMTLLGSLGSKYASRGMLAAVLGLLIGTLGMNTAGYIRGTFGSPELLNGIAPVPAMIGLLASSQLLNLATKDYILQADSAREVSLKRILAGCLGVFKFPAVLIRGSIIGIIIGAVPGVGSSIGNLIAYSEAKRTSKDRDTFGKGNPKGVVAAEAAVASSEGGSMATMLALGIPGGGATAILLAAFLMHNIVPGPSFIQNQKEMVYAIIMNNIIQCVLLLFAGIAFIYAACNVVKLRTRYVLPAILMIAVLGTYAVEGSMSGPATLFFFSILGFGLVRFNYPVAAVVVGILLGRMLETELLRANQVSGGDVLFILHRPMALTIAALMIFSLGMTMIGKRRQARADAKAAILRTTEVVESPSR